RGQVNEPSDGGAARCRATRSRRVGWEAGTRTPIHWSRASCPTIERPPSRSREGGLFSNASFPSNDGYAAEAITMPSKCPQEGSNKFVLLDAFRERTLGGKP